MTDADCTGFLQWALPQLRMRWSGFRRVRGQVCKRIGRRLLALGLKDLSEYRARLKTDTREWDVLDGLCRISISRFYRDRGIWTRLEDALLPRLAADATSRGETWLRIWSAGCASGEEPYTLALMFAIGKAVTGSKQYIVATDADLHLLERARRACYRPSSLRELPAAWSSAFQRSEDQLCLRPAYRAMVRFVEQDLRRDQPDGRFDLILCRNLAFTYFELSLQTAIAGRLAEKLVPGGLLLLGSHESLPQPVPGLVAEQPWLIHRDSRYR